MNNDFKIKKIKLNALIKKIAYEEHRKKWKEMHAKTSRQEKMPTVSVGVHGHEKCSEA